MTTNTTKTLSLAAWTIIMTLCCLQACLCACIPCCMDSCHKVRLVKFLFDSFIGLRKFRSSITAQTANNYWVCTVDLVKPTLAEMAIKIIYISFLSRVLFCNKGFKKTAQKFTKTCIVQWSNRWERVLCFVCAGNSN